MCRYKYGNEFCSHNGNPDLNCVGEENCTFKEQKGSQDHCNGPSKPSKRPTEKKEEEQKQKGSNIPCAHTEHGVYCQKYQRFQCVGKEHCSTEKEYHKKRKQSGIG